MKTASILILISSSLYGQNSVPPPSPPPELEVELERQESAEKTQKESAENRRRMMSQRRTTQVEPKAPKEKPAKPQKLKLNWCSAEALVAAYLENEVNADIKCKGKIVGVSTQRMPIFANSYVTPSPRMYVCVALQLLHASSQLLDLTLLRIHPTRSP